MPVQPTPEHAAVWRASDSLVRGDKTSHATNFCQNKSPGHRRRVGRGGGVGSGGVQGDPPDGRRRRRAVLGAAVLGPVG